MFLLFSIYFNLYTIGNFTTDKLNLLEWPIGLQHCAVARTVLGLNSTNACGHMSCKYVDWQGSADLDTVNRCYTRDESEDHTEEKACKGSTPALKPRTDITRSPKQWSYKRTCVIIWVLFIFMSVVWNKTLKMYINTNNTTAILPDTYIPIW